MTSYDEYTTLSVNIESKVALVTFLRSEQLNAINKLMQHEITSVFRQLDLDETVNVIVVTGAGRGFMAGADIKEYAKQTQEEFLAFQTNGRYMYQAIEQNKKPVIAAVNGFALGGGMELVLSCDVVLTNQYAKFGLPEVKLDLIPGGGGTQRSVLKLGSQRALWMMLTGEIINAETAMEWGISSQILPTETFLEDAMTVARTIASANPAATRGMKMLAHSALHGDIQTGLSIEADLVTQLYQSDSAQARIQAFANKNK
ncbi:Enoyl-CoA hydratase/isomerase [Vibrio nigripulchritudo SFn27]|uniref:Enoyl-CoA hydratase/isomerase n=1 Tax=Vibrio nigripulchritudo TaxID=28173 RepID=A0A9P1JL86_9VIBR|nr:enoyl-CoA hydratase-related protein [Vibrio nigripulchritudo]CBJ93075.1 Putative enoyl-CoA hydratase/isomerase [Vibrio nigripulchritudo]CCN38618.1 Enoyl-CoA hydratase/isomerase [Vibrio nigripulchritudo AM115]CCN44927.1 Enoyl-CoA hydratase/isomerase [Vibrio nigripulchritudo FTn2]CCN79682.1 Enoyl-CoA hydratase/isomerase [Vibrio nigripulchritudo SO65]CCN85886.1 Enoyl-CoA hydratase/isomerase [Vibrio nigripulchritudo BLFn1]